MIEKNYNNTFKFILRQSDVLLCEKIFDADMFNPFTRYSINIKDILPKAITKLQKTLSKKSSEYDLQLDCGRIDVFDDDSSNTYYKLYRHNQKIINSYPSDIREGLHYNPESIVRNIVCDTVRGIEHKTIRGVEHKFGFYLNENLIVERTFFVNEFNPISRWSVDILDAVLEIANNIHERIKETDINNMWDDYDLIEKLSLTSQVIDGVVLTPIEQVRKFTPEIRREMLWKINRLY